MATGAQFVCTAFGDPHGTLQGLSEEGAQVVSTVGAFVDRFTSPGGGGGGLTPAEVEAGIAGAVRGGAAVAPEVQEAIEGAMETALTAAPGAMLALGEVLQGVALKAEGLIPQPIKDVCALIWDECLQHVVAKVSEGLAHLAEALQPAATLLAALGHAAAATITSVSASVMTELRAAVVVAQPVAGQVMLALQSAMAEVVSAISIHGPVAVQKLRTAMEGAAAQAAPALASCAFALETAWRNLSRALSATLNAAMESTPDPNMVDLSREAVKPRPDQLLTLKPRCLDTNLILILI